MKKATIAFLFTSLIASCGLHNTQSQTFGGGRIINIADDCTMGGPSVNRIYQIDGRFSRTATGGTLLLDIMGTPESTDSRVVFSSQIFHFEQRKISSDSGTASILALYNMGYGVSGKEIYPTTIALPGMQPSAAKAFSNPLLSVNYGDKTATLLMRQRTPTIASSDYKVHFKCRNINPTAMEEIEFLRPEFSLGIW